MQKSIRNISCPERVDQSCNTIHKLKEVSALRSKGLVLIVKYCDCSGSQFSRTSVKSSKVRWNLKEVADRRKFQRNRKTGLKAYGTVRGGVGGGRGDEVAEGKGRDRG